MTSPSPTAGLTAEESAQVEAMRAQLRLDGYVEVDQHRQLRAGTRVRHCGHRWPEAYEHGTGRVLLVTEKPNSSWSVSWHMPDVEMLVLFDKASFGSRISQLAQYHVAVIENATTDAEAKETRGE